MPDDVQTPVPTPIPAPPRPPSSPSARTLGAPKPLAQVVIEGVVDLAAMAVVGILAYKGKVDPTIAIVTVGLLAGLRVHDFVGMKVGGTLTGGPTALLLGIAGPVLARLVEVLRGTGPLVVLAVLAGHAAGTVYLSACSGTAVHTQGIAANALADLWGSAGLPLLEDAYRADQRSALDRVCPAPGDCARDDGAAAVLEVRVRWAPVWPATEAARVAHDAWREQLTRCRAELADAGPAGSCSADLDRLALRFVNVVGGYRCAVRAARHPELDVFPGEVRCE